MEIFMFMIIFVTNMFIILIMQFAMSSSFEYKSGMYLGVHIPAEQSHDAQVAGIVAAARKFFKRFNIINAVLSLPVSCLFFLNIAVATIVYILWILAYCGGVQLVMIRFHQKMYALKMQRGWLVATQKRKIYIDTKVCADAGNSHIRVWYHVLLVAIQAAFFIPFLKKTDTVPFETTLVFFLCTIIVSLTALISHVVTGRIEKTVYSTDSMLNYKVSSMKKKYVCTALLVMNIINTLAWAYFAAATYITDALTTSSMFVYLIIELLAALAMLILIFAAKFKTEEYLSSADTEFIDDDEYWKTGFYYNPTDTRTFVPDRIFTTNYSFNYAKRSAQIFAGALTLLVVGCIIFTVAVMIPYIDVNIDISATDTQVKVASAGYSSELNISDITEIELFDSLPSGNFTKSNGGATDEYLVGVFKSSTYGKCRLYILRDCAPVLMIKTDTQTIFLNSETEGEIEALYERLKD